MGPLQVDIKFKEEIPSLDLIVSSFEHFSGLKVDIEVEVDGLYILKHKFF